MSPRSHLLLVDHERALAGLGRRWECFCCGAVWRTEGCVHGPSCDCGSAGYLQAPCQRCGRCGRHCECPEGFLTVPEAIRLKLEAGA